MARGSRAAHEVLTDNQVPDDEINKMTYENAMRWYHFDRSATSPRNRPPSARYAKPPKATTSPSKRCPTARRPAPRSPTSRMSAVAELTGNKD